MPFSYPIGRSDEPMPETFRNIDEFYAWSGVFVWRFGEEAYRLAEPMRLYSCRGESIPQFLFHEMERAMYDHFRLYGEPTKAGVQGLFDAFEKYGGGDYEAFVRFMVEHAMYNASDVFGLRYNAQFFAEHGFPKGAPRLNAKKRYKAVMTWLMTTAIRNTFRPMYEAWLNSQTLGEPEPEPEPEPRARGISPRMFRFDLTYCAVYLGVPEDATEQELTEAFMKWWAEADAEDVAKAVSWGEGPSLLSVDGREI